MFRKTIARRTAAVAGAAGTALGTIALAAGAASASPAPAPKPPPVSHLVTSPPKLPDGRLISSLPRAVSPTATPHITRNAPQDGVISTGELVQWYLTNFTGSLYDSPHNDPSYANNRFITAASGQGATVNHDAESVWNTDQHTTVVVCTGASYTGTCGTVGPNVAGNFVAPWFNGVSSVLWSDSSN